MITLLPGAAGLGDRLEQMVDTVAGLPGHPLLVHSVVGGVPLMSLVTLAVAVAVARPGGRSRAAAAWLVVLANAGLLVAAQLTVLAGRSLQARLGGPQVAAEHAELGARVPLFVAGVLLASLVTAVGARRPGLARLGVVLSVLAGVLAVWWVVRTGHSGASSVWSGRVPPS
ncbi:DUF2231 domain-containing protein [Quadrisphaera sp. DSM 44207]|uniref:DUF2231 domain-containing protein n=1 Tax=Quadrisphaera sp. DSM 44207 TaxID=1881057 RepID=UPI00088DD48F|nr:DUF2231 domain-containing protein [Quadrisphaera sp. DSM 44207]SDQ07943.1 hypothetical protein SAMN05428996_0405 [Quadrisphaera sp. DSM 44207]